MRASLLLLPVLLASAPAAAQVALVPPPIAYPGSAPTITVVGNATVKIAPDLARLSISIRGEGATPDAATRDLAHRQAAIRGALAGLDPKLRFYTGSVATTEHRKGDCLAGADDVYAAALSLRGDQEDDKGPCRTIGYTASIEATAEMGAIDQAGTAIGLVQRQGASSARLSGFDVADPAVAVRAAQAAAFKDALTQADMLAAAAGSRIARVESLSTQPEDMLTLMQYAPAAPDYAAAIAEVPPPVPIDVSPKPYEATAHLTVTFSLKE